MSEDQLCVTAWTLGGLLTDSCLFVEYPEGKLGFLLWFGHALLGLLGLHCGARARDDLKMGGVRGSWVYQMSSSGQLDLVTGDHVLLLQGGLATCTLVLRWERGAWDLTFFGLQALDVSVCGVVERWYVVHGLCNVLQRSM